jgi:hypothetical protein
MGLNMSGVSTSSLDCKDRPGLLARAFGRRSRSGLAGISDSALRDDPAAWRAAIRERAARRGRAAGPNPDPFNCDIVSAETHAGCEIMLVRYPGCTTFEGNKLLLFAPGVALDEIHAQGAIDPHFTNDSPFHHPIARFEPTERGLAMARAAAQALQELA